MSRTSFTEWSLGLVGDVRRRKVEFRRWSTTKSLRQAVLGPRSSGCPQDCSGDVPDSDQNLNLDSCDLGSQCKFKTLSAESSFDSRSEGSGSSEEEVASAISFSSINWISTRVPKCSLVESIFSIRITSSFIAFPQVTINSLPVRRKLATALSVPAYITSYAGRWVKIGESIKSWSLKKTPLSDYSSMTSSSGTPPSSSTDQLFDSDSAPSSPSSSSSSSPPPNKPLLKQTKSTSCSYFRSPKVKSCSFTAWNKKQIFSKKLLQVTQKGVGFSCAAADGGEQLNMFSVI